MHKEMTIILVGKRLPLISKVIYAFKEMENMAKFVIRVSGVAESHFSNVQNDNEPVSEMYNTIYQKVYSFIKDLDVPSQINILIFKSLAKAESELLKESKINNTMINFLMIDEDALEESQLEHFSIINIIKSFLKKLENHNISINVTANSIVLFRDNEQFRNESLYYRYAGLLRLVGIQKYPLRTDIMRIFADYINEIYVLNLASFYNQAEPVALGKELSRFMFENLGDSWNFYYYTGRPLVSLIDTIENEINNTTVKSLSGLNEHSLACGALSNWLINKQSYIITITSGMIDEFKGTLANLKQSNSRGFVVIADTREGRWCPFQGTIGMNGDARNVLEAKKIPYVYIKHKDELEEKLNAAYEYFVANTGPVFIIATTSVLECRSSHTMDSRCSLLNNDKEMNLSFIMSPDVIKSLDKVIDIINHVDTQLLWQVGLLEDDERDLVYEIADKSGIALVDSIIHPGSVCQYHKGKVVRNYIGVNGVYGFNSAIYHFFHTNNTLNPFEEQYYFFLKSKIEEVETPFSYKELKENVFIVQIDQNPGHIAPFANIGIPIPLKTFLLYLKKKINVSADILSKRNKKISEIKENITPTDAIPSLPMTTNYFFNRLSTVINDLITQKEYKYLGVYDVGRCGISAIRNIPRTNPSFSGWYGRALMGDALLSIPYLAINTKENILAFIGDGAKNLVPRIDNFLKKCILENVVHFEKNITIFYLLNGSLSLISTFNEAFNGTYGAKQTTIINNFEDEYHVNFKGIDIHKKTIISFDNINLCDDLQAKKRINYYDVILAHNSDGDGLTFLSEILWNRNRDYTVDPQSKITEKSLAELSA